ncbi:MAG: hypothetical protein K2W95_10820 [Candidatus Obscuribacterales bacterium]|nr:hypothetical protein [Candidatus Obscuribacterales bacterium]
MITAELPLVLPFQLKLPSAAPQAVATDLTRVRHTYLPYDMSLRLIRLDDSLASSGTPWVVSTFRPQPYAFANDASSIILASAGAIFAVTGDHEVTIKSGSLVIAAGQSQITIRTPLGSIYVAPGSSVAVDQDHFGTVRVASLEGAAPSFDVRYKGTRSELAVAPNQELVISKNQIASAGVSDFVPLLDKTAGTNASGLLMSNRPMNLSNANYGEPIACCEESALTPAMRSRLASLRQELADNGQKIPPSCSSPWGAGAGMAMTAMPIAHVQSPVTPGDVRIPKVPQTVVLGSCRVTKMPGALVTESNGRVHVESGEVLVDALRDTDIVVGNYKIDVRRGAILLVSANSRLIKLSNLCENSKNSVEVTARQRTVGIAAGQQIMIGAPGHELSGAMSSDGVARRRIQMLEVQGAQAAIAEFSVVSLFHQDKCLKHLFASTQREDRASAERILKMGACLLHVTAARGAYQKVASSAHSSDM